MIVRVLVFLAATGWVAWLYACGENCTPGTIRACTPNQGECAGATQTCNSSGNWGSCSKLPVPEMCDTLDNDCDGATDEIDAMALVHFVEAVPPVGDSSPRFLVGGLWGSSLLADLREKTAERTPSGDETQLAAVVTGTARAVVSPDGPQAVVAWIDGSSVELRLLDLVAPTPIVDDQATVSFDPGVEPLATIPVFEGNRLVLFTLVDNGDNTRSMLALPCDVTSQSVSCLPGGETTVVGGLSPVADFAVMVPSDPFTPMVLAYYQGPLKVQHVSRTTLQVEGVSRSFGGGRGMPSFAPGPGNSAALAYAVSGMLTLHRFEADTLLCSSPAQALDPMETCPDTVSPTGVGRPSVARRGNEWLIGHVSANEGWGVAIVDATDGTLIEERTETNTSPASTHLAINADDDVLVSQTNTQMGSSVRPLDVPLEDFYPDNDGDGYGAGTPTQACVASAGYVANGDDCDDGDSGVNPGADFQLTSRPNGSWDWNCDGVASQQYTSAFLFGGCRRGGGYWTQSVPPCGALGYFNYIEWGRSETGELIATCVEEIRRQACR